MSVEEKSKVVEVSKMVGVSEVNNVGGLISLMINFGAEIQM